MEKFFLPKLIVVSFLMIVSQTLSSQDAYCVFKASGKPKIGEDISAMKGSLVRIDNFIELGTGDYLLLSNKEGILFELNEPRKYSYTEIANYRKQEEQTNFLAKYFSFVWQRLFEVEETKQNVGVVYRADRLVALINPTDSVTLYSPQIEFEWKARDDEKKHYFFLHDLESDHYFKMGVVGSSITFFVDGQLLKPDKEYRWTVSAEIFPNLEEIEYHHIKLLDNTSFNKEREALGILEQELKSIGLSDDEIRITLCEDYKFCFD